MLHKVIFAIVIYSIKYEIEYRQATKRKQQRKTKRSRRKFKEIYLTRLRSPNLPFLFCASYNSYFRRLRENLAD